MEMSKSKQIENNNRRKPQIETLRSVQMKLTWAQENLASPFAIKVVKDMAGHVSPQNHSEEDKDELLFCRLSRQYVGSGWIGYVQEDGILFKHARISGFIRKKMNGQCHPDFTEHKT